MAKMALIEREAKRDKLVDRQVLAAKTVLADFIAWLGYIDKPLESRPDSRVNKGQKLFAPPARIAQGQLPAIGNEAIDHTRIYMGDWLVGLAQLIVDNAGHDGGREIKPEQNAELGVMIAKFRNIGQACTAANRFIVHESVAQLATIHLESNNDFMLLEVFCDDKT